jgi:hypothetical protein
MKPTYDGGYFGQLMTTFGMDGVQELWVWKEKPSVPKFSVAVDGQIVAQGLTRDDAATLAGLMLKGENRYTAQLSSRPQGEWVQENPNSGGEIG